MKVLYISSRLNVPDGSSVHGRAFVGSVIKLGHEIVTYPKITPLASISVKNKPKPENKTTIYYIKKLRPRTLIHKIKQLDYRIADGINFINGLLCSIKDFIWLRKIIKEFKPDVIIYRTYLYNFAAAWAAKMYKIPCVAEVNSLKLVESRLKKGTLDSTSLAYWSETSPLLQSDRVFCVSDAVRKSLETFLSPEIVSVIPNGVDPDIFDRSRYDTQGIRDDLGLAGKKVLGYAGSYQSWHDVDKSLDVIAQLQETDPSFHLLLIGNGHTFKAIKKRIEEQKMGAFVTQIDYVPHTEMPKFIAAFDIALMTYPIFDGFYFSPLKMYEYMSMGVPVVSTDIGQIREVIEHGSTGLLIANPVADDFVEAVKSITDTSGRLELMGENARREVLQNHSWMVNANQVMNVCATIVNSGDVQNI